MNRLMPASTTSNKPPTARTLVPALLSWFATNARDLPWRHTRDPYAIWVSEIMLQQTQVKTVIPYWERWMRALPTIESVAKARPAKLHKLWAGLGYYTRVRNLHNAARQIVARHDGKFPENLDDILALPGIGRYTAGAIASIAFNHPSPILDGNVIRVLTRLLGIRTDPRKKPTNTTLWQLAEALVLHASRITHPAAISSRITKWKRAEADHNCSHLNQSLMELGALVCTPRSPNCAACPIQQFCLARKKNQQDEIPKLAKRKAATARRFIAFVVERGGKFLVRQRPAGVVNAHLWEFPNCEIEAKGGRPCNSVRATGHQRDNGIQRTDARRLASDFRVTSAKPFCTIKHSITRYRITLDACRAEIAKPRSKCPGRWLAINQLHRLAFTSAHKKILSRLRHGTPRNQV